MDHVDWSDYTASVSGQGEVKPASSALAALMKRRTDALAEADRIEEQQRAAVLAVQQASGEVEELERSAVTGAAQVSQAARTKAERKLADARTVAAEPWAERASAHRLAAGDLLASAQRFAAEHLDKLLDERRAEGEDAVRIINAGAQMLLDGYAARAAVEARTFELVSMIRRAEPGDVQRSRSDALAQEAQRLLTNGGEVAPVVLVRPDEPRRGETAPARSAA
jgi:hypothetical protein